MYLHRRICIHTHKPFSGALKTRIPPNEGCGGRQLRPAWQGKVNKSLCFTRAQASIGKSAVKYLVGPINTHGSTKVFTKWVWITKIPHCRYVFLTLQNLLQAVDCIVCVNLGRSSINALTNTEILNLIQHSFGHFTQSLNVSKFNTSSEMRMISQKTRGFLQQPAGTFLCGSLIRNSADSKGHATTSKHSLHDVATHIIAVFHFLIQQRSSLILYRCVTR